jgi:predicted 2-oxoglutarate/Fe(II)-dependent dioxygenase YbiX
MSDEGGKTKVVVDHAYKSRTDFMLEDNAELCSSIRERILHRVVPLMERFFQYKPTRMERYMVSCYDTETGGHFSRHRDNINKGAEHRRFAASFNLNSDFDGCELMFPEFGRKLYKVPCGGGVIFSTGALHEVMPITRGKRYAFIPFFYGETEAQLRLDNNANLHAGEKLYTGEGDKLF